MTCCKLNVVGRIVTQASEHFGREKRQKTIEEGVAKRQENALRIKIMNSRVSSTSENSKDELKFEKQNKTKATINTNNFA